jgi:hypothetical protein
LLTPTLALGACGGGPDSPPEPEPTTVAESSGRPVPAEQDAVVPPGSRPLSAVGDLLGEYRVAGIDGTEVQGDIGIALSIDGTRLSYEPICAGFVWDIKPEGSGLRFERAKGFGPEQQPDGSSMACAVAVSPEQRRLAEAIDAARHAWRTPSNGILLEGSRRSVLMFSQ